MEKVNLIGQTFYDLTVIEEVECTNKKGVKPQLWKCKCVCGNEVVLSTTKVVSEYPKSCGCRRSGSRVELPNLIGRTFGRLTVLERAPNKIYPKGYVRTMWTCQCDCGTVRDFQADCLKSGATQSCGCLKSELTSERLSLQLEGQTFGKLTVIERAGTFIGEDGLKYSQWLCECECGSTKVVRGHDLVRGSVSSCGCLISKGEMLVRQELNKYDVEYRTQWWFDDLRLESGRPTRFDFALVRGDDLLGLIEYHGVQHYKEQPYGFGEQQRESSDLLKSAYCYQHHIRLWVIAYDQDISLKVQNIMRELNITYADPVPSLENEEGATTIPEGSTPAA